MSAEPVEGFITLLLHPYHGLKIKLGAAATLIEVVIALLLPLDLQYHE